LIDNVFYCAAGKWTMWRCTGCGSGYLDPRPNRASIHMAYQAYYTHTDITERIERRGDYASLSFLRKVRRQLFSGYLNQRFGTQERPALALGSLAMSTLLRSFKLHFEHSRRHLPRLPKGGGTVLDVGCGNGSFLEIAKSLGWDAMGVDPDASAVANCASRGLKVFQSGIERFEGEENLFDVITLSHVIEHMHDPLSLFEECYRLLKPDGRLWLETPNIDSCGHRRYGRNWRGLEPPRHLALFNRRSLDLALRQAGFTRVEDRRAPNPLMHLSGISEAIARGQPIDRRVEISGLRKWSLSKDAILQAAFPSFREFLTIVALKSSP